MDQPEGYLMIKVGSEKPYRESIERNKGSKRFLESFLESIHSLGFELLNDEHPKRKVVITSYALDDSAPRKYHKIHTFKFWIESDESGSWINVDSTFPWMTM
jgi:hypothetical protein